MVFRDKEVVPSFSWLSIEAGGEKKNEKRKEKKGGKKEKLFSPAKLLSFPVTEPNE